MTTDRHYPETYYRRSGITDIGRASPHQIRRRPQYHLECDSLLNPPAAARLDLPILNSHNRQALIVVAFDEANAGVYLVGLGRSSLLLNIADSQFAIPTSFHKDLNEDPIRDIPATTYPLFVLPLNHEPTCQILFKYPLQPSSDGRGRVVRIAAEIHARLEEVNIRYLRYNPREQRPTPLVCEVTKITRSNNDWEARPRKF